MNNILQNSSNGNAANQAGFPLFPLSMNRPTITSLNSYGRNDFTNPSYNLFGFAYTPTPTPIHPNPNPVINSLPIAVSQPSFLQTNYINGLLPTGNHIGLNRQYLSRPNNSNNSSDLHTFLNNRRYNILMGGGLSEFDHRYGDYSNYPVLNSMDIPDRNFRIEGTRNLPSRRVQEIERPKFRCVQCGKAFPTRNALGGHKSYHSKMRKIEALKTRLAQEANTNNSVGASTSRDRPIDLENEVGISVTPLKIRKLTE